MTAIKKRHLCLIGVSERGTPAIKKIQADDESWHFKYHGKYSSLHLNTVSCCKSNDKLMVYAVNNRHKVVKTDPFKINTKRPPEFKAIFDPNDGNFEGATKHDFEDNPVRYSEKTRYRRVVCCSQWDRVFTFRLDDLGKVDFLINDNIRDKDQWHEKLRINQGDKIFESIACSAGERYVHLLAKTFDGDLYHYRFDTFFLLPEYHPFVYNHPFKWEQGWTTPGRPIKKNIKKMACATSPEGKSIILAITEAGDIYYSQNHISETLTLNKEELKLQFRTISCTISKGSLFVFVTTHDNKLLYFRVDRFDEMEGLNHRSWFSEEFEELESTGFDRVAAGIFMYSDRRIQNIFVLMLENRSFDHMLGFSKLGGYDPVTDEGRYLNGLLNWKWTNYYDKKAYRATNDAPFKMAFDPGHEFKDVLEQLCGKGAVLNTDDEKNQYPPINCSGFVENYATTDSPHEGATSNFEDVMKCYDEDQLPVLNKLAEEFAVCDNWFSSLPGPTVPNRFFVMAASSAGLDDSPTKVSYGEAVGGFGYKFENGNLFDLVDENFKKGSRIYYGDKGNVLGRIPMAALLKGRSFQVNKGNHFRRFDKLKKDLNKESGYPYHLTFIEPSYGEVLSHFEGGNSQHPMDDVREGEQLIKDTYEAIRNSPVWEKSLLIITWDEHGGFYDHVPPPVTIPPGDKELNPNKYGFNFERLGVRVPAVIVSPFVTNNTIDGTEYDHASIPATIEALLGLSHLTHRDHYANCFTHLLNLANPRKKCITELPEVEDRVDKLVKKQISFSEDDPIPESGNLIAFLFIALKEYILLSPEKDPDELKREVKGLKTLRDARVYLEKVNQKIEAYISNNYED